MSNTVQFQNAYVEVLLDNFVNVVKQNVYIQAQNKIAEESAQIGEDMQVQAKNLAKINTDLQAEVEKLNDDIKTLHVEKSSLELTIIEKDKQVSGVDYINKDKSRLQSAVNDYMRQVRALETEKTLWVEEKEKLELRITALIGIAPVNKLKKIGISITKEDVINTSIEESDEDIIKNGGTF